MCIFSLPPEKILWSVSFLISFHYQVNISSVNANSGFLTIKVKDIIKLAAIRAQIMSALKGFGTLKGIIEVY